MNNNEVAELFRRIGTDFIALSASFASIGEDSLQTPATDTKTEDAVETVSSGEVQTPDKPVVYTKEDVRMMLKQKATADDCKYKAEVKALVVKYSSDGTLTSVPEDKYAELMEALEGTGNA